MYRTIEKHTSSSKKSKKIVGGDFNAELGPGYCVASVGPHTLNEGNKRGDWLTHWLMTQLSTRCTEKRLERKLPPHHDANKDKHKITKQNIRTQTDNKSEKKNHLRSKTDIKNSKKRSNKKLTPQIPT